MITSSSQGGNSSICDDYSDDLPNPHDSDTFKNNLTIIERHILKRKNKPSISVINIKPLEENARNKKINWF